MKIIRKIYYFLLIVYLSCKSIKRLNLGDEVLYKGKRYMLIQGVCNPKWDLTAIGEFEYLENIHKDNFKKIQNPKAWISTFKHTYNFYMDYWYGIWCRNGIEDWMKHCNIWQK